MHHGGIEKSLSHIIERSVSAVFTERNIHPDKSSEFKAELEIPKDKAHGDLSANIAMKACKEAGLPPLELAGLIKTKIEEELKLHHLKYAIGNIEARPPGFINFFLSKDYLCRLLLEIKRRRDN